MAQVETLTITASRKTVANYQTREAGYSVTVRLDAGEDPRTVIQTWTTRLQQCVDRALGDEGQPGSFAGTRPGNS